MILKFFPGILLGMLLVSVIHADEEIVPTKKTSGTLADSRLISIRPQTGVISGPRALSKLWAAWRPQDDVPRVDFKTQIVLVETALGPNTVMTGDLILDDQGQLEFVVGSTRKAGPGFGYLILVIPKKGIVSVNGERLNPSATPTPPAESIRVEIVGKIKTGIVVIGGETTGTVISSNGIVWELDLGDNRRLTQSARLLHSSTARVRGTLNRKRGVEVSTRWIVQVESIDAPGFQPPSSKKTPTPSPPEPPAEPKRLSPPKKTESIDIADITKNYKSISIVTTGGPANERQTLSISADGKVQNEIKARSIAATWTIAPSKLKKLHQFIDQTDWSQMRRLPRSQDPNVFRYEISIERKSGLTRILVDSDSIADEPTIQFFFQFFRRTSN